MSIPILVGAEAGTGIPQFNVMVAEHVLRWKPLSGAEIPEKITERSLGQSQDHFYDKHLKRVWVDQDGGFRACEECGDMPGFATDIAAAMTVAEALRTRGYDVLLQLRATGHYVCSVMGNAAIVATSAAATMPVAICFAALRCCAGPPEELEKLIVTPVSKKESVGDALNRILEEP